MKNTVTRVASAAIVCGLISSLLSGPAAAQVFRCETEDGSVAFSQTPCPNQKSTAVSTSSTRSDEVECRYANHFALETASAMRRGVPSDRAFAQYGGLDSISRGTVGIINYVYSFRSSSDVSVERIAALTQSKCKAHAFEDVSCEALPFSYTESFGGCDADGDADDGDSDAATPESIAASQAAASARQQSASDHTTSIRSQQQSAETGNDDAYRQCRKPIEDQIEAIDTRMRSGYSSAEGERYREQLRGLTQRLRDC